MVFLMFLLGYFWMEYVFWREVIYRLADIYSEEVGCVHYTSSASSGSSSSGSILSSLAMRSNSVSFIPVTLVTAMRAGFRAI
jgi:hypothetical protein